MELENKYNNSIVYKIVCNVTGLVYIGSTTQGIKTRLIKHKSNYKCYLAGNFHFITSFKILENNDFYIKKIKSYNFENNDDLLEKESYWIKKYCSVNKSIPNRTRDEYYEDNREEIKAKDRNRYFENKIEICAKRSVISLCICGCTYTHNHKARHEKSKMHLKQVAQI